MNAEQLHEYANQLRDNFLRLQDQSLDLHQRARALQVTHTSPDGLVTVTVGARGDLIRLRLDARVSRLQDSARLSDVITATAHQAAAMAQDEVVRMFEPLVPPEQMRAHLDGDLDSVLWHVDDRLREIG
ncbi:MAG: YbaB/EbfC family nucleoid-associated protein [Nonomuraea sp.]|nr:YbaB/EbfC family nucleoid-associated protein [Nonomuraea sp.]NUP66664.1 YbaB/EbfC family nucleoid-associated protein [Nonomuraea sp.]NUS08411.1 YbaB/EbfC family nucleoid-associated protein [Nonomuraea sp.]NUT42410.1 YbaB/EbfC family nucleoid-associated protein [Thermoactinospora sp.]